MTWLGAMNTSEEVLVNLDRVLWAEPTVSGTVLYFCDNQTDDGAPITRWVAVPFEQLIARLAAVDGVMDMRALAAPRGHASGGQGAEK